MKRKADDAAVLGRAKYQLHVACALCSREKAEGQQVQYVTQTKVTGRWVQHLGCPLPLIEPQNARFAEYAKRCGVPDLSLALESGKAGAAAVTETQLQTIIPK